MFFCVMRWLTGDRWLSQDKSLEKTNVKIDWNKFVDEDEDELAGKS